MKSTLRTIWSYSLELTKDAISQRRDGANFEFPVHELKSLRRRLLAVSEEVQKGKITVNYQTLFIDLELLYRLELKFGNTSQTTSETETFTPSHWNNEHLMKNPEDKQRMLESLSHCIDLARSHNESLMFCGAAAESEEYHQLTVRLKSFRETLLNGGGLLPGDDWLLRDACMLCAAQLASSANHHKYSDLHHASALAV